MNAPAELARFETLATRERLSLGVMYGARESDFTLLMAAAALAFAPGRAYAEREVNDRLRDWLAGAGAMLAVDHVELRRWLVDTGVLVRDGYGHAYERQASLPSGIAQAMDGLAGHDLAAIVRDTRARDAQRRAARKAQWQARAPGGATEHGKAEALIPRRADAALLRSRRDELVDLLADAVAGGASVGFLLPVEPDELRRFWDRVANEVEDAARTVFVCMRDDRVVGSVQLAPCGKANGAHRADVQKLLVHSRARRSGLGRALMAAAEAAALADGRWLLLLDTREASASDLMYRASGWIEYGRVPAYARDPDGALASCVFYYKRLQDVA